MEILYGRNVARECLRARRRHVHRVMLADNVGAAAIITEITNLARAIDVPVRRAPRGHLDKLAKNHQGVILEVGRYPLVEIDDLLGQAGKRNEPPFIIALDHIEDPHNFGAILRTAEIVGVHGVVIPKKRSVGVTATVVSASAGAVEHMYVAQVSNVVRTLKNLKQENVWVVGLEDTPEAIIYNEAKLGGAIAVVVGSEGKGMSRLVRETCDFLIKLPMRGHIESLNASVACSLILYEIWRTRGF